MEILIHLKGLCVGFEKVARGNFLSVKSMTEAWAADHKRLMQEWGK